MSRTGRFLAYLDRQKNSTLWVVVISSLLGLAIIDYLTGFEVSFAFFYVIPVSLASWALGRAAGRWIAVVSAVVWQAANLLAGEHFSTPWINIWNTITRLGFFLIISTLLTEIHTLLQNESQLSRTDHLTGILNRRAFFETAGLELQRVKRNRMPLTIAYLDLDDFKIINDTFGHQTGDQVLQKIAGLLSLQLRRMDTVARVGGDEFAILLPETNEEAAHKVTPRLFHALQDEIQQENWPITFSMGILTCAVAPLNVDELLHLADQLMYDAKKEGKDTSCYGTYPA